MLMHNRKDITTMVTDIITTTTIVIAIVTTMVLTTIVKIMGITTYICMGKIIIGTTMVLTDI